MADHSLQAPFPWFGGKSRAAPIIWDRLGLVDNYVEPFAGSLAVLFGAPRIARNETVNDKDGLVSNFWRSVAHDPEAVAHHADWPVNEIDLTARHLWLVKHSAELTAKLEADPYYFDSTIAGWWCWGLCCWIGGGWCSGEGPWSISDDGSHVEKIGPVRGVNRQLPHLGPVRGVNRQLPHLGTAGAGVNRKVSLVEWFAALSARLSRVRVCCGDWSRVCTNTPTTGRGLTGIVLDPPYSNDERCSGIYSHDDGSVAADCREWALSVGNDPLMRIALCGYDTEHEMPGWTKESWKTKGGFGNIGHGRGLANRFRETIWFSPHCQRASQGKLFG